MPSDRGFLTIAQNTDNVDYLKLAYVQAMSIKITMPDAKYAVIVDSATEATITNKHREVFDHVIVLPTDDAVSKAWKLHNDWQAFKLTPFTETIKLEADLLVPRNINHWWHTLRLRDVVVARGCRDYQGNISESRQYRRVFDRNSLPDVYSGMTYWRYSRLSTRFGKLAQMIFQNWGDVAANLVQCNDSEPTTDLVYALICRILGEELTTIPTADFFNFVHMKPAINSWPPDFEYTQGVNIVVDAPNIRINNIQQHYPFHYHTKTFVTDEIIDNYEFRLRASRSI